MSVGQVVWSCGQSRVYCGAAERSGGPGDLALGSMWLLACGQNGAQSWQVVWLE